MLAPPKIHRGGPFRAHVERPARRQIPRQHRLLHLHRRPAAAGGRVRAGCDAQSADSRAQRLSHRLLSALHHPCCRLRCGLGPDPQPRVRRAQRGVALVRAGAHQLAVRAGMGQAGADHHEPVVDRLPDDHLSRRSAGGAARSCRRPPRSMAPTPGGASST